MATNPVTWNFNGFDYLTPTELRSGNSMPYSFNPSVFNSNAGQNAGMYGNQVNTNPFANYSSIGMGGLFDSVGSLCSFADTFTTQTAPMIAQAKAYNDQIFSQGLYQAQQTSALRDYYRSMGINPDSVLNQNQNAGNNQLNQLTQLINQLGGGGTVAPASNTSNNQLNLLAQALGLGGTVAPAANTSTDQLSLLAQALGLGGTVAPASNTSTDQLGLLLGLLGGLGGTTTTTKTTAEVDDWWNHTDDEDSSDSDDAFWANIEAKAAQSRQQNQQQNQLQTLLNLLNGAQA